MKQITCQTEVKNLQLNLANIDSKILQIEEIIKQLSTIQNTTNKLLDNDLYQLDAQEMNTPSIDNNKNKYVYTIFRYIQ